MVFSKQLRDSVRRGEITQSVRYWLRPKVRVGGLYPMEEGLIEVTSVERIEEGGITEDLARESGFASRAAMMEVARHGSAQTAYLVTFRYLAPGDRR